MPKPKGWTEEGLKKRDRCVQHLLDSGHDKDSAYAICTAMVNRTGQHDKNGPGK